MAPDASGGGAVPVLNGRFELVPGEPLRQLDSPSARAFAARDRRNPDRDVFALVAGAGVPVRYAVLKTLKSLPETGILGLLDYGAVPWPEGGGHRFALVYDHPLGWRLGGNAGGRIEPMAEDALVNALLAPLTETLGRLARHNLTHRAIRPDNLFRLEAGGGSVILGDCASAPAAYGQPPAYEPIESLMADRAGRGAGRPGDDIYALGVTVLALLTGADPGAGRGAAELLAEKMTRGSYHALAGGHDLSPGMREVLHGMLEDRPEARWGVAELAAWLSDRTVPPVVQPDQHRPERSFVFNGLAFYDPRALATAMAGHWDNVVLTDGGHEFLTWARQSLGEDVIAERVLTAMELSKRSLGSGRGAAHPAFVARLCMALDDQAPIRYKRVSAHADGLGTLLAASFADQDFQRDMRDLFLEDLAGCRIRMTHGKGAKAGGMARTFSRLAGLVKDGGIGSGIERCLYELNPAQHCLSPLIADQGAIRLRDVLPALERVAAKGHREPPMDRHLAAFIAARAEANTGDFVRALNETDAGDRVVTGILGLLAVADTEGGARRYPGLARWLEPHLAPAVDCFHHSKWRDAAKAELPGLVAAGDIGALYRFVANGEARRRDRDGYAAARARSARIDKQIRYLNSALSRDPKKAEEVGHGLAVGFSAVVFVGAIAVAATLMF